MGQNINASHAHRHIPITFMWTKLTKWVWKCITHYKWSHRIYRVYAWDSTGGIIWEVEGRGSGSKGVAYHADSAWYATPLPYSHSPDLPPPKKYRLCVRQFTHHYFTVTAKIAFSWKRCFLWANKTFWFDFLTRHKFPRYFEAQICLLTAMQLLISQPYSIVMVSQ